MATRRFSSQALTGLIVVLLGVLLLLGTTGTYDVGRIWRYVPSLFVLLGCWAIVRSGFRNVAGPLVLIVVAGTIQLLTLGYVTGATIAAWWPLLIVLVGLSILFGRYRHRRRVPTVATDDFDVIGIFGGSDRRVTSRSLTGGAATALFGGVELDLRDAAIADRPAVVAVTALFGGVELHVPTDWDVQVDALPVFGGVEDDRSRRAVDPDRPEGPDLLVSGFVAFGGITITD